MSEGLLKCGKLAELRLYQIDVGLCIFEVMEELDHPEPAKGIVLKYPVRLLHQLRQIGALSLFQLKNPLL